LTHELPLLKTETSFSDDLLKNSADFATLRARNTKTHFPMNDTPSLCPTP